MILERGDSKSPERLYLESGVHTHQGLKVNSLTPNQPEEFYANSLDYGARNLYLEKSREKGESSAPITAQQVLHQASLGALQFRHLFPMCLHLSHYLAAPSSFQTLISFVPVPA